MTGVGCLGGKRKRKGREKANNIVEVNSSISTPAMFRFDIFPSLAEKKLKILLL